MIESVNKLVSAFTPIVAVVAFLWTVIQYLDQRKREERTKRYELYHSLMRRISAVGEKWDEPLALTEQVASIYELQQFKDYAYASVPILEDLLETYRQRSPSKPVLLTAIERTIAALR